jgi:hypothetical protein
MVMFFIQTMVAVEILLHLCNFQFNDEKELVEYDLHQHKVFCISWWNPTNEFTLLA